MIALAFSLLINLSSASTDSQCVGEGLLFYEGQCFEHISATECKVDPNSIEINNSCYKLQAQNSCESDFSLSIGDSLCVDTSSFSNVLDSEVFTTNTSYNIEIKLIPKKIKLELSEHPPESNWYMDRVFNTHSYSDLIDTEAKNRYSFSAPLSLEASAFRIYDEHIVPELLTTLQSQIEKEESLSFKLENKNLLQDSKLNIAKALESLFSKYGNETANYNIYVGIKKLDENQNTQASFAGLGLPMQNGQFEIKVFSSESPKNNIESSNTLESLTGVELSLLNISSGSYIIDIYGNIHQMQQDFIDNDMVTNQELETVKGWVLGTRVKTSKNLDLSVEVGESKINKESSTQNTDGISLKDKNQEEDLQLKLSVSYVFSL